MIEVANKYSEQLKVLFYDTWYDDRYRWYINGTYSDDFSCNHSNWERHEFVSKDDEGIIGYISYNISRVNNQVSGIGLINFRLNDKQASMIFGIDFMRVFMNIFDKYNFHKILFNVVVGNPVEPKYDKIVKRLGGRVVGTYKEDTRLMDNKLYDVKMYEILRSDYMSRKVSK